MAQLHQVIGAILRDIAQARVTSDIYSRDVSQYYEKDSLLRIFPVPRSEIREANVDMKFLISGIEIDPERKEDRESKTSAVFEYYSELMIDAFFSVLREIDKPGWIELFKKYDTPEFSKKLRTSLLDYFENNSNTLINDENELDQDECEDGIKDVLGKYFYDIDEVEVVIKKENLITKAKSNVTREINELKESMAIEIRIVRDTAEDYKLDVEVTAAKLMDVPEAALSSVKLTIELRNYLWSQVEKTDDKIIRRLIPE